MSTNPEFNFEGNDFRIALGMAEEYGNFDDHMCGEVTKKFLNNEEPDETEKLWMAEHPEIVHIAAESALRLFRKKYRAMIH